MEFRILGPIEVLDGNRRVELPAGRGRALLALLVLHAGEIVSAERLIDELWGENPPATAHTVIQGLVSRLRKELEPRRAKGQSPTVLQTAGTGYRLAVGPESIDAGRFKRLVDEARLHPAELRAVFLSDALRLWRGPALADFAYEPFAQRSITALDELRLTAIEDRIDAEIELGRVGDVMPELESLIVEQPFRERTRALLMLALYRAGRQAEALDAFRAARDALVAELGIEPGPALRELQQAILRQDASLGETSVTQPPPRAETSGWLPGERRMVTVVAADLAPSSDADAELVARLGARATEIATEIFSRHGARLEHVLGELLVAFFGFPVAHEDDALRAVRAAVELRAAIETLGGPDDEARPSMRAGIDAGDIVVGGPGASLRDVSTGRVVGSAGRLQQAAADGEILVGPVAQRQIRGAVIVDAQRDVGGVAARRVLDIVAGAPAIARSLEAPMFGRQTELTRLRSAYRRCVRSQTASRIVVAGEPGIGKSRLAREFVDWIGHDATVIAGRCPAYGEGITFLPLRELISAADWSALARELDPDDAEQIAAAVGFGGGAGNVNALFGAVRRLLEVLAAERPLVVVLEDVHWAEPTFLDLIEQVSQDTAGRVLILCLSRPELFDRRPEWRTTETLLLGPLEAGEISDLVADRAGALTLEPEMPARIVETSRGNPLFAEQLLAALEDGNLEVIPSSLQGLLAMRLDRLGPGERDVLRCAAVVGVDLNRDALLALLPEKAHGFVDRHTETLERKQLIVRGRGGRLRFGHVLIQRAAYQSMTRGDRASLHERFGHWLVRLRKPPPDLDEIAGYHLEQAVEHRRAVGAESSTLASEAGEHLANAAERALARADQTAAENLMTRARALLGSEHPRRLAVTQSLAEVSLVLGRFDDAQRMLDEIARTAPEASARWAARLEHARIQFIIGPDPVPLADIRRVAEEADEYYSGAGDDAGRERALFLLACVYERAGEMVASAAAFRETVALADRSGHVREMVATRWMLAEVTAWGPLPAREALDVLGEIDWSPWETHPGVLLYRAELTAMSGDVDEARRMTTRAREIFIEGMRAPRMLMFVADIDASIALLAGDMAGAERELRTKLEFARSSAELDHIAQAAARLSIVLRARGRAGEASEAASLALESAPAEGITAQGLARMATALLASDAGDHESAARAAVEAVALVSEEMPRLRGDLLVGLAEIARVRGDDAAAAEAESVATRLYATKGNVVSAQRLGGRSVSSR